MNVNHLIKIMLCSCVLLHTACMSDEFSETQKSQEINMTASNFHFDDSQSRTSFEIDTNGAIFNWAEKDTVGIFPEEGAQVYFPMSGGAGTNMATFTGGGWALKPSSSYVAYFPFNGSYYLDRKSFPVTYYGQIYNGNTTDGSLGKFDYMVAKAVSPKEGSVDFNFEHLGCLIELSFKASLGYTNVHGLVLRAQEQVFMKDGIVDLTAANPQIAPTKLGYTFYVNIKNVKVSQQDEIVKVYFMLPASNLENTIINAEILFGRCWYQSQLQGKNMKAGKAYKYEITEDLERCSSQNGHIDDMPLDQWK